AAIFISLRQRIIESSGTPLPLNLIKSASRFLSRLVYVRRHIPFSQFIAQLHSKECTGRIPGNSFVVPHYISDRVRVSIHQMRSNVEIIVVDDRVYFLSQWRKNFVYHLSHPLDIFARPYVVVLEIHKEEILLRVIGEPFFQRESEEIFFQTHRLPFEYSWIHQAWWSVHDGFEAHQIENVTFQVNSRGYFYQLQPIPRERKDTTFCNIEYRLLSHRRIVATERFLLNLVNEF